jgi:hypothetical protein
LSRNCDKKLADGSLCGSPLSWKEWDNEQGGFWACPDYKQHAPKAAGGGQRQGPPQGTQGGRGAPNGGGRGYQGKSPEEIASIERQVAAKGACDVVVALVAAAVFKTAGDAEAAAVRLTAQLAAAIRPATRPAAPARHPNAPPPHGDGGAGDEGFDDDAQWDH